MSVCARALIGAVALTAVACSGEDRGHPLGDAARDAPASGPDPACAAPGCLRSATLVGDYDRATLEPLLDPRVQIDNGYSLWTVEYVTGDRTSLATIAIPFDVEAPAAGYSIVVNNHGTTGLDDPCAISGTVYGAGLAGLFGARGMIGVAPDYPGLGTAGLHPYLVLVLEGKATLDAMRAARSLTAWLGIATTGTYAAAGMSQGGHATLAAAMLHEGYAPELDIRGFAAAAPASVFEEQWRAGIGVDGPHVAYHVMLTYAWTQHYGYAGPSPWAAGQDATVATAMQQRCIVAMNGAGAIADALGEQRSVIFAQPFLDAYTTGSWGSYAAFGTWFDTNRVVPYPQTAPLKIYQGDADQVVLEPATAAMVSALRAGGVVVDYEVVPGGTHTDVAFGYVASYEERTLASIAWLRDRLR